MIINEESIEIEAYAQTKKLVNAIRSKKFVIKVQEKPLGEGLSCVKIILMVKKDEGGVPEYLKGSFDFSGI